jgi:hypothetical protein
MCLATAAEGSARMGEDCVTATEESSYERWAPADNLVAKSVAQSDDRAAYKVLTIAVHMTATTIDVHDAQTQLMQWLTLVLKCGDVVICEQAVGAKGHGGFVPPAKDQQ